MNSASRSSVVVHVMAVAALVLPLAMAQVPFLGKCPNKQVVQNFNVEEYLGKWYELQRYFAIFEAGNKCVTATYTAQKDGSVGVDNAATTVVTNRATSINGTATLVGNKGEAKLEVRFPSVGNFPAPYWILDTDYKNYAVVWSCVNILGVANTEFAWVLTRAKNPSDEVLAAVSSSLKARSVETLPFTRTAQTCDN